MTVLYLDTSSSSFFAALYHDGKIVSKKNIVLEKDMSSQALPLLKEMLDEAHILPNDVDKILVCNGPGSFTGIRIGITIAKVYAWAFQKDIAMLSSLEAMALSTDAAVVLPIIDARRGYVYGACYRNQEELIKPGHYILKELLANAKEYGEFTIVSNDCFDGLDLVSYQPNYLKIIEAYKDRENISPHLINPVYLKKTEAEEKLSE